MSPKPESFKFIGMKRYSWITPNNEASNSGAMSTWIKSHSKISGEQGYWATTWCSCCEHGSGKEIPISFFAHIGYVTTKIASRIAIVFMKKKVNVDAHCSYFLMLAVEILNAVTKEMRSSRSSCFDISFTQAI